MEMCDWWLLVYLPVGVQRRSRWLLPLAEKLTTHVSFVLDFLVLLKIITFEKSL